MDVVKAHAAILNQLPLFTMFKVMGAPIFESLATNSINEHAVANNYIHLQGERGNVRRLLE